MERQEGARRTVAANAGEGGGTQCTRATSQSMRSCFDCFYFLSSCVPLKVEFDPPHRMAHDESPAEAESSLTKGRTRSPREFEFDGLASERDCSGGPVNAGTCLLQASE